MDISVIIVEYNDFEVIQGAIDSIKRYIVGLRYEIIIVSNSCYPESKKRHMSLYLQDVDTVVFNYKNSGFAGGVNRGIKEAKGKYILLLNPDARLMDYNISAALSFIEKNQKVAVIGPKVVDSGGVIQDSFRPFITLKGFFTRQLKRVFFDDKGNIPDRGLMNLYGESVNSFTVDWVSGLCMLVRRDVIDDVGYMDEKYFMYVEDMDWCRQFWCAGYEVWFFPQWKVCHDAKRASSTRISVFNKLMWFHFLSIVIYFLKWSVVPCRFLRGKR